MDVTIVRYRTQPERASNPLTATAAFGEFVRDIADRCEEGPVASSATVVGDYRFLGGGSDG